MLNILISSNDLNFICSMVNNLTSKYENIRIYNISIFLKDTMKQLKYNKKNIDLAIIRDFNHKITKFIKAFESYDIPIFFISKELNIAKDISSNIFFYNNDEIFLNEFQYIVKSLRNIKSNNTVNNIKDKVYSYLLEFGYSFSHLGTKYLAHSIITIFIQNNDKNFKLEREVYPIIAERYNVTINNIKCNITLATKYMNEHVKTSDNKFFSRYFFDDYINTKSVINCILQELNRKNT